jgi:hypothetical protein
MEERNSPHCIETQIKKYIFWGVRNSPYCIETQTKF